MTWVLDSRDAPANQAFQTRAVGKEALPKKNLES